MTTTASTHEAPLGRFISAIAAHLNPLAPAPRKPSAPLEYRPTRRLASSLTAAAIGSTIAARRGGNRGTIMTVTHVIQDGTPFVQILASAGASRFCRPDTEIVIWGLAPAARLTPARSTPTDEANRRARAEMITEARQSAQERLAGPGERGVPATAPRPLRGILTGLVG